MNPTILCEWLIASIAAHPHLPSLVGDRSFPDQAPRGTDNPCLVYQIFDSQFESDLDAETVEEGEFSIQIRAYGSSRKEANEVRHRLRAMLTAKAVSGPQVVTRAGEDDAEFRVLASSVSSFDDTYEENSEGGDDYGAVFIWNVTATETP